MSPEDLVLGVTVTPVPEPWTWMLMLAGFAGLSSFWLQGLAGVWA
jgi:hypothetical protein